MATSKRNRKLAIAFTIAVAIASRAEAQSAKADPRTPWGDPDLQGVWSIATITPFERPAALKDKAQLTPEEAAEAASKIAFVGVKPLGRYTVTRRRLVEMISVLEQTLVNLDNATGGGGE